MAIWRPIPGWTGYEASSLGQIRRTESGRLTQAGRIIGSNVTGHYAAVSLKRDGKFFGVQVHPLVASAFLGPVPSDRPHINHIDGNKHNNDVRNLEYVTAAENNRHAVRTGLNPLAGEDNHQAKVTDAQVLELRAAYSTGTRTPDLQARYGLSKSQVTRIVRGVRGASKAGTNLKKPNLDRLVLNALADGREAQLTELVERIKGQPRLKVRSDVLTPGSLSQVLGMLAQKGSVVRVRRGWFRITDGAKS